MSTATTASATTAPTEFLRVKDETYAFRRIGGGFRRPLLCLQHFTGTLDNWDPAVTDPLGDGREVILFDSAGVGRSTGKVPTTVAGMAAHGLQFLDGLCVTSCDVLGFSLGGMVAQQMAIDRPSSIHRMILVGTAPRGGEDIMHLEKPSLARHLGDPTLKGYAVLQKIFFAPTSSSQAAGGAFIERLAQRCLHCCRSRLRRLCRCGRHHRQLGGAGHRHRRPLQKAAAVSVDLVRHMAISDCWYSPSPKCWWRTRPRGSRK
jgi:pimeloyl-ACP methyl ester carboxylesterase